MPNRVIKESITTSETLAALSLEENAVFFFLTVVCDDFGLYDARPLVIKNKVFSVRNDVTVAKIERWLRRLVDVELIQMFEVDGRPFFQMLTFRKHQTQRAEKSKFPGPDGRIIEEKLPKKTQLVHKPLDNTTEQPLKPVNEVVNPQADVSNGNHPQADASIRPPSLTRTGTRTYPGTRTRTETGTNPGRTAASTLESRQGPSPPAASIAHPGSQEGYGGPNGRPAKSTIVNGRKYSNFPAEAGRPGTPEFAKWVDEHQTDNGNFEEHEPT